MSRTETSQKPVGTLTLKRAQSVVPKEKYDRDVGHLTNLLEAKNEDVETLYGVASAGIKASSVLQKKIAELEGRAAEFQVVDVSEVEMIGKSVTRAEAIASLKAKALADPYIAKYLNPSK